jgi:hypothetical protein
VVPAKLTEFLSKTQTDGTWTALIAGAVTKCDNAIKSKIPFSLAYCNSFKSYYGVSAGANIPKFDTCDGKPLLMLQCIQGVLYAVG